MTQSKVTRDQQKVPDSLMKVIEAVMILLNVKPLQKRSEGKAGGKVDDYWEPAKSVIFDDPNFLSSLMQFDRDNVPVEVIEKVKPYIEDTENFTGAKLKNVSAFGEACCLWVHGIYIYHFASQHAAPKRVLLAEAESKLGEKYRELNAMKEDYSNLP